MPTVIWSGNSFFMSVNENSKAYFFHPQILSKNSTSSKKNQGMYYLFHVLFICGLYFLFLPKNTSVLNFTNYSRLYTMPNIHDLPRTAKPIHNKMAANKGMWSPSSRHNANIQIGAPFSLPSFSG